MNSQPGAPAFPVPFEHYQEGMSKLEYMATHIMQGALANPGCRVTDASELQELSQILARFSINSARELIQQLNG